MAIKTGRKTTVNIFEWEDVWEDYLVYGTSKTNVYNKLRSEKGVTKKNVRFKTIL